MRGDWVEIVIDAGDGVRVYDVAATRAGRRVEVTSGRGLVEVSEVTRGGTVVRTARFMSGRVVALVEHPAEQSNGDRRSEATTSEPTTPPTPAEAVPVTTQQPLSHSHRDGPPDEW
jgi:hypothetical protein